ncbi:ABC transporter permease [Paenibacillus sp. QZ-Y1]|uniref:ABC transporter permease n=1 Tax=Paenibacillus sp. QZ-Y1 TaxID=3414511 RepID=UPI003F78C4E4
MHYWSAIKNEHIKLYSKRSTWITLGIAFASTLIILLLFQLSGRPSMSRAERIQFFIQTENQIIYLLLITAVSQSVCGELSSGTARMLFIHPLSRVLVILSKLATSLIYAANLFLMSMMSCIVIAYLVPATMELTMDDLLEIMFVTSVKLVSILLYTCLFFSISLLARNMTISIVVGIIFMSSIQALPSMMIFPETSFLMSFVMWLSLCIVLFIGAVIHFSTSDIP